MKNLTGVWNGLYSYPDDRQPPVPFTARLSQAGDWLTGATEEVAQFGEATGSVIAATLTGRVSGQSVTFLKTYDRNGQLYDAVQYRGDLDQDGLEIDGTWTVPGNWSGRFLMIRASAPQAAGSEQVHQRA